jgi:hypothetical protein
VKSAAALTALQPLMYLPRNVYGLSKWSAGILVAAPLHTLIPLSLLTLQSVALQIRTMAISASYLTAFIALLLVASALAVDTGSSTVSKTWKLRVHRVASSSCCTSSDVTLLLLCFPNQWRFYRKWHCDWARIRAMPVATGFGAYAGLSELSGPRTGLETSPRKGVPRCASPSIRPTLIEWPVHIYMEPCISSRPVLLAMATSAARTM